MGVARCPLGSVSRSQCRDFELKLTQNLEGSRQGGVIHPQRRAYVAPKRWPSRGAWGQDPRLVSFENKQDWQAPERRTSRCE